MRALALAWLVLAGAAMAVPVTKPTASVPPPSDAPQPDEMPGAAAFGRGLVAGEPVAALVEIDAALDRLPRPTRFRGLVLCARGYFLALLERPDEALPALEDCRRLRPDDPAALWLLAPIVSVKEPVRGARLLLAAIRADPRPVPTLERGWLDSVARRLDYAGARDLRIELSRALVGAGLARDDPAAGAGETVREIRYLLKRGDTAGAAKLLPRVLTPDAGLELLIDRRYEPIWPQVEAWAGRTLATQRDAYVSATKAAFEVESSADTRKAYASALYDAGRLDEAVAVLRGGFADADPPADKRFERIVMAIRAARYLGDLGQGDAGLILLRGMKAANPPDRVTGGANIMPNEVQLLLTLHRPAPALALLDGETPPLAGVEDAGALAHYAALRACAQGQLGRATLARAGLADIQARALGNRAALRMATFCVGTPAERRQWWLARLADEDDRGEALTMWARAGRPGAARSSEERVRDLAGLRGDPVLKARMDALGRALPESFGGALDGWRVPPSPPAG